jgi:hypothetical protein
MVGEQWDKRSATRFPTAFALALVCVLASGAGFAARVALRHELPGFGTIACGAVIWPVCVVLLALKCLQSFNRRA